MLSVRRLYSWPLCSDAYSINRTVRPHSVVRVICITKGCVVVNLKIIKGYEKKPYQK
jgi:hypothetical protein